MHLVPSKHRILSQRAAPVMYGVTVDTLVAFMMETCRTQGGVGLAAPQLGSSERVIVIYTKGFKREIVNPVIMRRWGGQTTQREGCLSFPGLQVPVVRDKRVHVEGFDRKWDPVSYKFKGIQAIVAQHEIDHLDGITIASRLKKQRKAQA